MKLFGFHFISDRELQEQLKKAKLDEAVACAKICFDRSLEFTDVIHKQTAELPFPPETAVENEKQLYGNMTAEQACSGDYHRIVWRIEAHKYGKDLDDDE